MILPLMLIMTLTFPLPAHAGDARKAPVTKRKALSIAQLIARAMSEGIAKQLSLSGDKRLGYTTSHPCKKLQYDDKVSGDGYHHRFQVVIDEKGKPLDVIIGRVRMTESGESKMVDSHAFRMDTAGKLISAIRGGGPPNKLIKEELDISKPETMSAFKQELEFFTHKSRTLPLAKVD